MKKTSLILAVVVIVCALAVLSSCRGQVDAEAIWEDAIYTEDVVFGGVATDASDDGYDPLYSSDATIGNGAKTVYVTVKVGDKSVTFTIKTDKEILGDALLDYGLIDGEEGPYGLYIKKVNGIIADYDIDQSYWGFYKGGEYMMSGIDSTVFADGESYELVYTK